MTQNEQAKDQRAVKDVTKRDKHRESMDIPNKPQVIDIKIIGKIKKVKVGTNFKGGMSE